MAIAMALGSGIAPSILAFEESCRNQSDTRFALVIGNSYSGRLSGRLDAEAMADQLCQLGFSVDLQRDAGFAQDDVAIAAFRHKIEAAQEVVFFYSGHGYQIGGENYLLPNDRDVDIRNPQLPLSRVLWALKGAPDEAIKILFLDACRKLFDPPAALQREGLAGSHGFPPSTLLSYATEYGQEVPSGRADRLSPYSAALTRSIREPGLSIFELLARVSQEVAATQTPIYQVNNFPGYTFNEARGAAAAPVSDLGQRIRARLDAYGQGNAAAWAAFVADDCFCAGETKADIQRAIANRPAGVKSSYGEISGLEVHAYGDVAVARYRVIETTEVEGKLNKLEQLRTETHVRQSGSWTLVAAAESIVPQDPQPIALPREVLARYAGRYEYTPGSVDAITLEGDRIFVESTGEPKVEIFPESEKVFFAKGQPWRLVFVTGPQGVPVSVAFRQNGQEYVAKRLP